MRIMRWFVGALIVFFLASVGAQAQTQTFSLTGQAVALPGNHQTVPATVSGITMTVTPNFDLREDNVITSDAGLMGFFGGFNYRLPILSTKLNNASPTLNGNAFQFYITASAGVDRLSIPAFGSTAASTAQHYAFLAGGGVNYRITAGGAWTFGAEIRYAKLPGYQNNTAIVSVGPTLHF